MTNDENKQHKTYAFWVGTFRYHGTILSQDETHYHIQEHKEGPISIPKATTTLKEVKQ